jgi:hypothetical protein
MPTVVLDFYSLYTIGVFQELKWWRHRADAVWVELFEKNNLTSHKPCCELFLVKNTIT